ncbi:unnamed protein product [Schistosoma margrebowiei]|uniref:Uncharacterized protein n=1 Tax=Schistosoma margrebowiei TaxID=48269 RepID=A0A183LG06_9TREM|nr:unnamed protein product [Schistosoma margrebowiei]
MGSSILREQMANEPIVGHRLPWDCNPYDAPLPCGSDLQVEGSGFTTVNNLKLLDSLFTLACNSSALPTIFQPNYFDFTNALLPDLIILLAKNYKFIGTNVDMICEYNASVCLRFGQPFLVRFWLLLRSIYGSLSSDPHKRTSSQQHATQTQPSTPSYQHQQLYNFSDLDDQYSKHIQSSLINEKFVPPTDLSRVHIPENKTLKCFRNSGALRRKKRDTETNDTTGIKLSKILESLGIRSRETAQLTEKTKTNVNMDYRRHSSGNVRVQHHSASKQFIDTIPPVQKFLSCSSSANNDPTDCVFSNIPSIANPYNNDCSTLTNDLLFRSAKPISLNMDYDSLHKPLVIDNDQLIPSLSSSASPPISQPSQFILKSLEDDILNNGLLFHNYHEDIDYLFHTASPQEPLESSPFVENDPVKRMQLNDLDFADDLALLSQTQQQMQEKMTSVAAASAAIGLYIHKGKSRILRYNTECTIPITIDGEALEDVKTFTYLGSIMDEHGGSDADVRAWIGKARAAYLQLRNIWNLKQLSANTKVKIFNTNVKTVLLYGAETWRTTKAIIQKIQVFINNRLRKILQIRWPDTISNNVLWENKPDPSGGRNQEEALEVDRTHIEENTQLRHKTGPHMESSRPKEKRKTKEHITPGSGDRHEKNEQELDGIRKECPGLSGRPDQLDLIEVIGSHDDPVIMETDYLPDEAFVTNTNTTTAVNITPELFQNSNQLQYKQKESCLIHNQKRQIMKQNTVECSTKNHHWQSTSITTNANDNCIVVSCCADIPVSRKNHSSSKLQRKSMDCSKLLASNCHDLSLVDRQNSQILSASSFPGLYTATSTIATTVPLNNDVDCTPLIPSFHSNDAINQEIKKCSDETLVKNDDEHDENNCHLISQSLLSSSPSQSNTSSLAKQKLLGTCKKSVQLLAPPHHSKSLSGFSRESSMLLNGYTVNSVGSLSPISGDINSIICKWLVKLVESGHVQTVCTALLALGPERLRLSEWISESILEHWLISYLELLSRFRLWTVCARIIKQCGNPFAGADNQTYLRERLRSINHHYVFRPIVIKQPESESKTSGNTGDTRSDVNTRTRWKSGGLTCIDNPFVSRLNNMSLALAPGVAALNQASTTLSIRCGLCTKPLCASETTQQLTGHSGWACSRHATSFDPATITCALCHLVVRGLFVCCRGCSHGGHLDHMQAWLMKRSECPTGCGHRCRYD